MSGFSILLQHAEQIIPQKSLAPDKTRFVLGICFITSLYYYLYMADATHYHYTDQQYFWVWAET